MTYLHNNIEIIIPDNAQIFIRYV